MENGQCLKEQMIGDLLYDGINGPEIWIDKLCIADMLIECELL